MGTSIAQEMELVEILYPLLWVTKSLLSFNCIGFRTSHSLAYASSPQYVLGACCSSVHSWAPSVSLGMPCATPAVSCSAAAKTQPTTIAAWRSLDGGATAPKTPTTFIHTVTMIVRSLRRKTTMDGLVAIAFAN